MSDNGQEQMNGCSRRDFLGMAFAATAGAVAANATPLNAFAVERGFIGDWSADGSRAVAVPDSAQGNGSGGGDATYRDHFAAAFPANDATPIAPRPVPAAWDYECDVVVVGAGGGGLNAAARSAELGAQTICVESAGLQGETPSLPACARSWVDPVCRKSGASRCPRIRSTLRR